VSTPEDVDEIFKLTLLTDLGPFRAMDQVGLDVVYDIEEHYGQENPALPTGPRCAATSMPASWASSPARASTPATRNLSPDRTFDHDRASPIGRTATDVARVAALSRGAQNRRNRESAKAGIDRESR
jgi:3-hydroxyacyl-CoA dehydrogenase, C-terminal domain